MRQLCIYGAVGLLLALAALRLYRRRCMETASDAVAVDILKPIFKYCMCLGGAEVFCAAVYNWFFKHLLSGTAAALPVLALLLTGASTGCFAAEMLPQKTVRGFGVKWKGFIVSRCILVALCACVEYDVFGYERYIQEPAEIESVRFELMDTASLREGDSIAAYDFMSFSITVDAVRCGKWTEVRGLELQSMSAVEDAAQKYS